MGRFDSKYITYKINLKLPEASRWDNVIRLEKSNTLKFFQVNNNFIYKIIGQKFGPLYKENGGLYVDEIESWSDRLDLSFGYIAAMNCQYSLYNWYEALRSKINIKDLFSKIKLPVFGCTAGIKWNYGLGMIHIRNMDWPLNRLGNSTRLFEFHRGKRKFYSVGVLGQIGVFSGMLPKKYAITINWAPVNEFPDFEGYDPSFLLRWVFENCDNYQEALNELKNNLLSTNVFFTISGVKEDEAAVIERTKSSSIIRKIKNHQIVQSNHFVYKKFNELNKFWEPLEESDSYIRKESLEKRMNKFKDDFSPLTLANCLDDKNVLDEYSYQQMLFIPKTGDLKLWRWID